MFMIFSGDDEPKEDKDKKDVVKIVRFERTQIVPYSDQIITFCSERNKFGQIVKLRLVLENDPTRRNRSLVGPRHLH